MNNIHLVVVFLLCWNWTWCSFAARPNVVLIVADDLGYGDLGCYGSQFNDTPHIDTLSKQGIRFTDYHSSGPMCTPTRVSILTGKYQQRFGPLFDGPLSGESQRHLGLPSDAVSIAEVLGAHGYTTACLGKWHLGFRSPHLPTDQGFDLFRGLLAGDGDHHSHIDRYGNEDWWDNRHLKMEVGYAANLLTDHAVRFIEKNQAQPFFLYLPHLAIHFPWQGPDDQPHREKGRDYQEDKWGIIADRGNVRPHVAAMVESLDENTGKLLATLERLKLREQTIVIFTSDNGGYLTYGKDFKNISSNGRLRGQKGTLYEGGHRVPLVVSWPKRIQSRVSNSLVHSNDLFPTICNLVGIDAQELGSDGQDNSRVLLDGLEIRERTLFWRAGNEWAIRSGPWKLVKEQESAELFDLDADIEEKHDMSQTHVELVDQLSRQWKEWNETMPR